MTILFPRHHYMIKILDAVFQPSSSVEGLFSSDSILEKVNHFLSKDGPQIIFFTCMGCKDPLIVSFIDFINNNKRYGVSLSRHKHPSDHVLICALENCSEMWNEKWLYFFKPNNNESESSIDITIHFDSSLVFGLLQNGGTNFPIFMRNLIPTFPYRPEEYQEDHLLNPSLLDSDGHTFNMRRHSIDWGDVLNSILFLPQTGYEYELIDCSHVHPKDFVRDPTILARINIYVKIVIRWCIQIDTFMKKSEEIRSTMCYQKGKNQYFQWNLENEFQHWKSKYVVLDALCEQIQSKPRSNLIQSLLKFSKEQYYGAKFSSLSATWIKVTSKLQRCRDEAALIKNFIEKSNHNNLLSVMDDTNTDFDLFFRDIMSTFEVCPSYADLLIAGSLNKSVFNILFQYLMFVIFLFNLSKGSITCPFNSIFIEREYETLFPLSLKHYSSLT